MSVSALQDGQPAKTLIAPCATVTAGETVRLVEDAGPSAATPAAQAAVASPLAGTARSSQAYRGQFVDACMCLPLVVGRGPGGPSPASSATPDEDREKASRLAARDKTTITAQEDPRRASSRGA